jgi:hypothetical protein
MFQNWYRHSQSAVLRDIAEPTVLLTSMCLQSHILFYMGPKNWHCRFHLHSTLEVYSNEKAIQYQEQDDKCPISLSILEILIIWKRAWNSRTSENTYSGIFEHSKNTDNSPKWNSSLVLERVAFNQEYCGWPEKRWYNNPHHICEVPRLIGTPNLIFTCIALWPNS